MTAEKNKNCGVYNYYHLFLYIILVLMMYSMGGGVRLDDTLHLDLTIRLNNISSDLRCRRTVATLTQKLRYS